MRLSNARAHAQLQYAIALGKLHRNGGGIPAAVVDVPPWISPELAEVRPYWIRVAFRQRARES